MIKEPEGGVNEMFGNIIIVLQRDYQVFLEGIVNAMYVSLISLFLALIVGILGGVARYHDKGIFAKIASGYVTAIRNTPLLVQIYFIFFGLPRLGVKLSAVQTGIIGLTLNSGAYITEMIRSGLQAIPKGQKEAAVSLALTNGQTMRKILIPQAAPRVIPAVGGQFIQLVKDSSLLSMLAVVEITKAAENVGSDTFNFLEAYFISGLIYLFINIVLNLVVDQVERKYRYSI
jgi:His/Glu/Gln/Arg/opine family amino acid ABC transporter permease subunit